MQEEEFIGLVIDDKYRLDRKIGEGGMGAVYLGTQLMVDRHVAIKLLHSGLSEHERIKQRFEVEAKAIGRMHHPNCITLFDFGFSSHLDAFYMVMEYLEGTPMHKRVYEGVTADEAVEIARQVALALDHAHHQGILHRDLKPENVMITRMTDGSELTKVLDFGIARIFSGDDSDTQSPQEQNRLTKAGEVFGTPAYISPEQARGERELTPASDLYSLGVMFFEMLTGELPFWGDTAMDTIMKHITEPVPPINRLDVPKALKDITYALLDKNPRNRPQSGRDLVSELDMIILQRKQAALQASDASTSMSMPITAASAATAHPTVPDLTPSDYNEWAEAGATVVKSAADLAAGGPLTMPTDVQNTPPRVDLNFGAQRAPARAMAPSAPPVQPQPASTGPMYTLDALENPYDDLPEQNNLKMLPIVGLVMVLVIAAGVGVFLMQKTDDTPPEDTTEQASTSITPVIDKEPAQKDSPPEVETSPEPKTAPDAIPVPEQEDTVEPDPQPETQDKVEPKSTKKATSSKSTKKRSGSKKRPRAGTKKEPEVFKLDALEKKPMKGTDTLGLPN